MTARLVDVRVLATVATAGLLAAAPAIAPAQRTAPEASARSTHVIAACLVRNASRPASAFLATAPTQSQARLLADLGPALNECAAEAGGEGQELRLSAAAVRGPIAEAFFERDFNGWSPRNGRRPVTVYPATPPPAEVPRARLLADMAACVADARPADVLTLLATSPASAGEGQATAALVPALGPCFRAGQTADVSRSQLRGLLAEAAYRRAAGLAGTTAAR